MAVDIEQQALFDYGSVSEETRKSLQQHAEKIRAYTKRYVVDIGRELVEARDELRHNKSGGFEGWVALEFGWSRRSAYNFISAYESFGNCANFAQLDIADSALYILAPASEEVRNKAIERADAGEKITYAIAKDIVSSHKAQQQSSTPMIPFIEELDDNELDAEESPRFDQNKHVAYCKYCYSTHDDWSLGSDYDGTVWICGKCDHATHDNFMQVSLPTPEPEAREIPYSPAYETKIAHAAQDEPTLPVIDVKEKNNAHVMRIMGSSESPEWYTPQSVIDRVIELFGVIDTDPCSNSHEAPTVPARTLYTKDDDGLAHTWEGKLYLNPPYGTEIGKWTRKLVDEYEQGNVEEALALLPARIDTAWFEPLYAYPMCNVRGRIQFANAMYSAPFPCVIVYLGKREHQFIDIFKGIGPIMRRIA